MIEHVDDSMGEAVEFEDPSTWEHLLVPSPQLLGYEHVEAEAGEGSVTLRTIEKCERTKAAMGDAYYAELLYVLTRRRHAVAQARALWTRILAHRDDLRLQLGRNPGIAVAALDYLANVEGKLVRPTFIDALRLSRLVESATRDALTGLYDRAALWPLMQRARDASGRLSVLMLDVDHFKRLNDEHGHLFADVILTRLCALVIGGIRDADVPVRYGGEEICIVLPGQSASEACAVAERLRERIERELAPERVTVSIGVATHPDHATDLVELVRAADDALYASKRAGRNRVTLYDGVPTSIAARARESTRTIPDAGIERA